MLYKLFESQRYDAKFISYIIASYLAPIDKNKLIDIFPKFNINHKICKISTYINNFLLSQPPELGKLINIINNNVATCSITGGCALKLYTGYNWDDGDIDMEIITQYPTYFLNTILKKNHYQYDYETKSDMLSRVKTWYIEKYDNEYYEGVIVEKDCYLIKLFLINSYNNNDFKIDIWIHNEDTISNNFDLSCCKIRTSPLIYPNEKNSNPYNNLIINNINKTLLNKGIYRLDIRLLICLIHFAKKVSYDNTKSITINVKESMLIKNILRTFERIEKYNSRGFKLMYIDIILVKWCKDLLNAINYSKYGLTDYNLSYNKTFKLESNIKPCEYFSLFK